jgi:hypothetical protein
MKNINLEKQIPKNIYNFKKGDKITRIQPSKPMMKIGDDEFLDRNYIGSPFIFIGIANGCIYLKRIIPDHLKEAMSIFSLFGDSSFDPMIHLELEIFEDGWDYYIDPNSLGEETIEISLKELEKQKRIALEKEDYKEVDRINKLIKKIKSDGRRS